MRRPWRVWGVWPGQMLGNMLATCGTRDGAVRVATRALTRRPNPPTYTRISGPGEAGTTWTVVDGEISEIPREALVLPALEAEDTDMTTTQTTTHLQTAAEITGCRKGYCYVCTARRIGPSQDARNIELCDRCYDEGSLENEHSDYGHAEPVKGCPTCGLSTVGVTDGRTQSASTIDKAGTCECATCHHVLPVTKFPTITAKGTRGTTCRECRDYATAGKRIGRPAHVVRPTSRKYAQSFFLAAVRARHAAQAVAS